MFELLIAFVLVGVGFLVLLAAALVVGLVKVVFNLVLLPLTAGLGQVLGILLAVVLGGVVLVALAPVILAVALSLAVPVGFVALLVVLLSRARIEPAPRPAALPAAPGPAALPQSA